LYVAWGESECKGREVRRGWRDLHEEGPDAFLQLARQNWVDEMKENMMGGTCGTYGGVEKCR
jgi:hypothetical protein